MSRDHRGRGGRGRELRGARGPRKLGGRKDPPQSLWQTGGLQARRNTFLLFSATPL